MGWMEYVSRSEEQKLRALRAWNALHGEQTGGPNRRPRIILARHGETSYDIDPERFQGNRDIPLTPKGMRRSVAEAARICSSYVINNVFSSDLQRASFLARAIADRCDVPLPVLSADFRSWDVGDFAGTKAKDSAKKIEGYISTPDLPLPGGEAWRTFVERFMGAFLRVTADAVKFQKTSVLVSHSRCFRLVFAWLENPDFGVGPVAEDDPVVVGQYRVIGYDGTTWGVEASPYDSQVYPVSRQARSVRAEVIT